MSENISGENGFIAVNIPPQVSAELDAVCQMENMPKDVAVTEALQMWLNLGHRRTKLDDLRHEVQSTFHDIERREPNQINPLTGKPLRRRRKDD